MSTLAPNIELLETISLAHGAHKNIEEGACAMEAVAYIAGEPFSDHPQCVSPIIASFMRSWNDSLGSEDRDRLLKPLLPMTIGTVAVDDVETRRFWMIIDWLIRDFTPPWLRLAKLNAEADTLASVAEINSPERIEASLRAISAAKKSASAAWDAARDAAGAAPRDAAGDAPRDAAGAAAWDAARDAAWHAAGAAAWDAARDAARDAAWAAARAAAWHAAGAAAWDAARAAAGDALKPTVATLQASAVRLVERMCAEK